jgi:hypothetical protein
MITEEHCMSGKQGVKSNVVASWRTTTAGVLAGVALALPELIKVVQGETATVNWELLVGGLAVAFGLVVARDNKVSSEDAGVK